MKELDRAAIDAEECVLGAVLLRPTAYDVVVAAGLTADDFLDLRDRAVWTALGALVEHGQPIDITTLCDALDRMGLGERAGGPVRLAGLQARVPTAENVEHYARIVVDRARLRAMRALCARVASDREDLDADSALEAVQADLYELSRRLERRAASHVRDVLTSLLADVDARKDRGSLTGVPTGYPAFDALTCGLQPAELAIVAARPSVGKTSLAVALALHAGLDLRLPVLLFSLEMSRRAVVERMVCSAGSVRSDRVRSGQLDGEEWRRLTAAASRVHSAPLWVDDSPSLSVPEVRAKARRFRSDHASGLGLVVVDYLQLLPLGVEAETREREVAAVGTSLKRLSRELDWPVLALAQLRRSAEEREGPPRLSDLRESGSLEQDADLIAFLHRQPKCPKCNLSLDADPPRGCGCSRRRGRLTSLVVAKQRNGPTGDCELVFLPSYARFEAHDGEVA